MPCAKAPATSSQLLTRQGLIQGLFVGSSEAFCVCSDPLVLCLGLDYMHDLKHWFSGFILLYSFTFLCDSRLNLLSRTVHFT